MKAAIIQSSYLPWKGYFDIIHDVDIFIFLDNVAYTKRDWRTRNYIKRNDGQKVLLTVPVEKESSRGKIEDVVISPSEWQASHLGNFLTHYARAPHFRTIRPLLEDFYIENQWRKLSEMNQYMIRRIAEYLGISTYFENASRISCLGEKTERLISLLKQVGANEYLTGPSARNYIDERLFVEAGIQLQFKQYDDYPVYQQLSEPFTHEVSILDLLLNVGDRAPSYIWGFRQ